MPYQQLLSELKEVSEEDYKAFHKRLLKNPEINVLGVRVPALRRIAKKYSDRVDELLTFPDEYYEVTFVKLTAVSCLNYSGFIKYIDKCISLINNWATCDCFIAKCIANHKDEFMPYILKYSADKREFFSVSRLLPCFIFIRNSSTNKLFSDCPNKAIQAYITYIWRLRGLLRKCW